MEGLTREDSTDLNAGRHVRFSGRYLSKLGADNARMLPANTVAVCCIGATIGKCGLIEVPAATNQQINCLVPNTANDAVFLYYLTESPDFKSNLIGKSSSTTLPILNKTRFEELIVKIPTKNEQKEIAQILDSALARVERVNELVALAFAQLAVMKRQLVAAALAGKLQ